MVETPTTRGNNTAGKEFWRDIKPMEQVFRLGALPELYIANAPIDDERFYVPLSETVGTRPCSSLPVRTGGATSCSPGARDC